MNPNLPPQRGQDIDLSKSTAIKCDSCSNEVFVPGFMLRRVSALVNPSGKDIVIQIPVQVCNACGSINDEFVPQELKNQIKLA